MSKDDYCQISVVVNEAEGQAQLIKGNQLVIIVSAFESQL